MIKKIGRGLLYLMITGVICMSTTFLLSAAYVSCYIFLVVAYLIVSFRIIGIIYNFFAKEEWFMDALQYHTNWWQNTILVFIILGLIILLWFLYKNGIFDYISQIFAYRVATTFYVPGHGEPFQINLN